MWNWDNDERLEPLPGGVEQALHIVRRAERKKADEERAQAEAQWKAEGNTGHMPDHSWKAMVKERFGFDVDNPGA